MKTTVYDIEELDYNGKDSKWIPCDTWFQKRFARGSLKRWRKRNPETKFRLVRVTTTREVVKESRR